MSVSVFGQKGHTSCTAGQQSPCGVGHVEGIPEGLNEQVREDGDQLLKKEALRLLAHSFNYLRKSQCCHET